MPNPCKTKYLRFLLGILLLPLCFHLQGQIFITADNSGICPNDQITLRVAVQADYSTYEWFGENAAGSGLYSKLVTPPTDPKVSIGYVYPGKYYVEIKKTDGSLVQSEKFEVKQLIAPSATITPTPVKTEICTGDNLKLEATTKDNNYVYKWLLNGTDENTNSIVGATLDNYTVTGAGTYYLRVKDITTTCITVSSPYTVTVAGNSTITFNPTQTLFCDINQTLYTLTATPLGGAYTGTGITNPLLGTFSPKNAGVGKHTIEYRIATGNTSCPSVSATRVLIVSDPKATITSSLSSPQLCTGSTATLTAPIGADVYTWTRNGVVTGSNLNQLPVTQGGKYELFIKDKEGCTSPKETYDLVEVNAVAVTLDPILPVCGTNNPIVTLAGKPTGGIYSGDGVIGDKFDPKVAGTGNHVIKYQLNGTLVCEQGKAEQTAAVNPIPQIELGENQIYWKNDPAGVMLRGNLGTGYTYSWSPATKLSNATIGNPLARPDVQTKYELTVTSAAGCPNKDDVTVYVYQRVSIPDVFSPNNDSRNDVWEIFNLDTYTEAEVQVFDRWGTQVFYSKGNYTNKFDGTLNGQTLPTGSYIYTIVPNPADPSFRYQGSITILR